MKYIQTIITAILLISLYFIYLHISNSNQQLEDNTNKNKEIPDIINLNKLDNFKAYTSSGLWGIDESDIDKNNIESKETYIKDKEICLKDNCFKFYGFFNGIILLKDGNSSKLVELARNELLLDRLELTDFSDEEITFNDIENKEIYKIKTNFIDAKTFKKEIKNEIN